MAQIPSLQTFSGLPVGFKAKSKKRSSTTASISSSTVASKVSKTTALPISFPIGLSDDDDDDDDDDSGDSNIVPIQGGALVSTPGKTAGTILYGITLYRLKSKPGRPAIVGKYYKVLYIAATNLDGTPSYSSSSGKLIWKIGQCKPTQATLVSKPSEIDRIVGIASKGSFEKSGLSMAMFISQTLRAGNLAQTKLITAADWQQDLYDSISKFGSGVSSSAIIIDDEDDAATKKSTNVLGNASMTIDEVNDMDLSVADNVLKLQNELQTLMKRSMDLIKDRMAFKDIAEDKKKIKEKLEIQCAEAIDTISGLRLQVEQIRVKIVDLQAIYQANRTEINVKLVPDITRAEKQFSEMMSEATSHGSLKVAIQVRLMGIDSTMTDVAAAASSSPSIGGGGGGVDDEDVSITKVTDINTTNTTTPKYIFDSNAYAKVVHDKDIIKKSKMQVFSDDENEDEELSTFANKKVVAAASSAVAAVATSLPVWQTKDASGNFIDFYTNHQTSIEGAYQKYVSDSTSYEWSFIANSYSYSVDFGTMKQTNISTGAIRALKRNLISSSSTAAAAANSYNVPLLLSNKPSDVLYPHKWLPIRKFSHTTLSSAMSTVDKSLDDITDEDLAMDMPRYIPSSWFSSGACFVPMPLRHPIYADISKLFKDTDITLVDIHQIQHPSSYERYYAYKSILDLQLGNSEYKDPLFVGFKHLGSPDALNTIINSNPGRGFVQGNVGAGYSMYVSPLDVIYHNNLGSNPFVNSRGEQFILMGRALTGRCELGNSYDTKPNAITGSAFTHYNSTTDSMTDPNIFNMWEYDQILFEYAIRVKTQ